MCVVFAETEIVGLLAQETSPEDIVAGVQAAIAARVAAMAGREVAAPVVFTGGVALVPGMDVALRASLGQEVDRGGRSAADLRTGCCNSRDEEARAPPVESTKPRHSA